MSERGGRPDEADRLTHLRDGELAAFVDGRLSPAERRRVEAHIDVCDPCRAELVEVGRAVAQRGAGTRVATPISRRWWIPIAAAAGIVAILLVPRLSTRSPATNDPTRATRVVDGEGQRRIDVVAPLDDVTLPAAQLVFTWHAVPADVYRFSLLSASGDSIWARETTDTSIALPTSLDARPGGAYFWRVDAIANGIVATTGDHRVQLSP